MIRCWLFRLLAGQALDANRPPSVRQRRHLASCAACRRHYDFETRMLTRLSAGARPWTYSGPESLHHEIMAHWRRHHGSAAAAPSFWSNRRFVFAAAAGLLVVSGLLMNRFWRSPTRALVVSEDRSLPSRPPFASSEGNPVSLATLVEPARWPEPLESELKALAADARTVADLVVHNFLPNDFSPDPETE